MAKRIVLCADDYGQDAAVSKGIIDLIHRRRLSATSCMTNSPFWLEQAQWLLPFRHRVDIGLHFNLTEGQPLSAAYQAAYGGQFKPLSRLMARVFLHRLQQKAVEAELHAQLDAFVGAMHGPPTFIDGHQHIHQLPIIRAALVRVYKQRLHTPASYVRLINERPTVMDLFTNFKLIIIYLSGSGGLQSLLTVNQILHNSSFAGIYPFSRAAQYAQWFPTFLTKMKTGGIVMCHPGYLPFDQKPDQMALARYAEYQYLASHQWVADCQSADVTIQRFFH